MLYMFISATRYWLLSRAMETPPLSILKKLGRLPNPKYGNIFDVIRKPQPLQPEQQQNNNNTNIKISSQEEVSPMTDISETTPSSTPATPKTPLLTEDTGKILEKAICDVYGTPYDGAFVYSQEEVDKLIPRVSNLKTANHFPQCHHTASNGARYDFASDDGTQNLSAKSNKKKGGKVAPQVIGQPSAEKFCQVIGIQDPATIADEICAGMREPARTLVVLDRAAAIRTALMEAGPADVARYCRGRPLATRPASARPPRREPSST